MRETQAMMTLKGSPAHPAKVLSCRAGQLAYARERQDSRSRQPQPDTIQRMRRLERHILQRLERFHHMPVTLSVTALQRERVVTGIPGYQQSYQGFWGSLGSEDTPLSVFGSDQKGDLVFRRGPWEDWPRDLPELVPAARVPIIFSPYCGTLLHEAVGHAVEAEYLGESPLHARMGKRVAGNALTIMDRPDLVGYPGSMSHDDVGRPASETTLVHRGFLVGDLGFPNGVLRRGSYRELPLVRASNFLVAGGSANPDDWLRDLQRCYYVTWLQSGNWEPGSERIKVMTGPMFELHRGDPIAYRPWSMMSFSTLALLDGIMDLGNDLCMDPVTHWCMKSHQAVPMGMGSPSLLHQGLAP